MPGFGGASNWGLRSLADCFLRYYQPSVPTYLRLQIVDVRTAEYAKLGFIPAVSGAQPGQSGIVDILIDPPADSVSVSTHNIGQSGGRLQFGARTFTISHTFVLNQMQANDYTDPYQVWRNASVVGLYANQRLFSIESITKEEVGGETTLWFLTGNLLEYPITARE